MILSAEEREKFATYLEQDALSAAGIIAHMQKASNLAVEALIRKLQIEIAAQRIVAAKLRSAETMDLKPGG